MRLRFDRSAWTALYRVFVVGLLAWIGWSARDIAMNQYSGPSSNDEQITSLGQISEQLDQIAALLAHR